MLESRGNLAIYCIDRFYPAHILGHQAYASLDHEKKNSFLKMFLFFSFE
jgi:hypothetical protein